MAKSIFSCIFVFALVVALVTNTGAVKKRDHNDYNQKPYRVVCYFGSWAFWHEEQQFKVTDIDPKLCTHANYAFAKMNEYTYEIEVFDDIVDIKNGGYKDFVALKKDNPELTTMISLGGWYEASEKYSDMVTNVTMRTNFVKSVVNFLGKYGFDGLDLDWEYPAYRGGLKSNKENFIKVLEELKEAFKPHGYLLTAALSPGKSTMDLAYIVPKLNDLLDWGNVMTYDYHGGWEDFLGHNSPLYPRPDELDGTVPDPDHIYQWFNINYTINYYLELGLKRENMVMGVPFYGRAWTIKGSEYIHMHDPAKGMSPKGFIGGEPGVLGYTEVCQMELGNPKLWTNKFDPYYEAPYAYNDEIFVGYDDVNSIECKLTYLKEMGLSGGMIWKIDDDDWDNHCRGGKYPLLHKVDKMLNGDERQLFKCIYAPEPTPSPTPSTTEPTTITTTEPTTITTTEPTTRPTTEPTSSTTLSPHKVDCTDCPHDVGCKIPFPYNVHKYIECEWVEGKGWWVFHRDCPEPTIWDQEKQRCEHE